jgi:hypothetical protein
MFDHQTTLTFAVRSKRRRLGGVTGRYLPRRRRIEVGRRGWDCGIGAGDAVLYRADPTLPDLTIAAVSGSPWIHAGMLAWDADAEQWEIIDTQQWRGGRRTPLVEAVRANPGHWDHFAANPHDRWPEFNRRLAVAKMDEFVDRPYGWLNLICDGLSHLPVLGALISRDLRDGADDGRQPYCSQAVAIATRVGGGVDVVPHRTDAYTEPVHLAQSLFYEYRGTFWPAEEAA